MAAVNHNSIASVGLDFTLVSTAGGSIFSFGSSRYGQLGNGSEMNIDHPEKIGASHPNVGVYHHLPILLHERIVHVSGGYHHAAAVSSRGVLYTWGRDTEGCLGHGENEEMTNGVWMKELRSTFLPSVVRSFLIQEKNRMRVRVPIERVSCGSEHTLAVDEEGSVWSWGNGAFGALGHGDTKSLSLPKKIVTGNNIKATDRIVNAVAGAKHSLAISQGSGHLFSWGMGDQGRLGNGTEVGSFIPQKVLLSHVEEGDDICTYVATGEAHSAICTAKGHVYTWGVGSHGRLGHDADTHECKPRKVLAISDKFMFKVACGK
jgi:alpha-tubulin suppressor-like RCC1 family protein